MVSFASDLRHAVRVLRRAPAFAFTVVAVLALGIGSNSAVFSALDQTVIRPLPYADSGRLAMLWEDFSAFGSAKNRVSPATFLDWRRRAGTFDQLAASAGPGDVDLSGGGRPEQVLGLRVTANLLPLLGVAPLVGRTFASNEEGPDARVVVLSYRLWQRRFGGDPSLAGRPVVMNGQSYTVIGIMPRGFAYPDRDTEVWLPLALSPQLLARRNSHFLKVVGRLRRGRTLAEAQSDMQAVAAQLAREFPATNGRIGIAVVSLKSELLGSTRVAFLILISAAACVLLIACANVGNLALARNSARRQEVAVRMALGATRGRVLRHILTENLLLALAGGALGVLFAMVSLRVLQPMVPSVFGNLHLDWRALSFTGGISLLTGLLFGLAPALQLARSGFEGRGVIGRGGRRLRDLLVIAEVAIALVLVVGAALLIETMARLHAVDPGFRPDHVLTAEISVPFPKYADSVKRRNFYREMLERVGAIPGVLQAGLTSDLPYNSRGNTMGLTVEGRPEGPGLGDGVLFRLVSAGYLESIGARLKRGRFLSPRDSADSLAVAVINESLARAYWPGQNALGRRIDAGTGDGAPLWMTVVGVVADVRERGLDWALKPAVYVPFTQTTIGFFVPEQIAVRTAGDPLSIARDLQQAVWSVDPEQPVAQIRPMMEIVEGELAERTRILELLGAFAALALLMAALGIYGVLSYVVSQKRREIGLRMAVGASQWDVVRQICAYAARLTGIGVCGGVLAAMAATRLLSTLLYGVSPLDPRAFAAVVAGLAAVALAASCVPARRAARVDPAIALREE